MRKEFLAAEKEIKKKVLIDRAPLRQRWQIRREVPDKKKKENKIFFQKARKNMLKKNQNKKAC